MIGVVMTDACASCPAFAAYTVFLAGTTVATLDAACEMLQQTRMNEFYLFYALTSTSMVVIAADSILTVLAGTALATVTVTDAVR